MEWFRFYHDVLNNPKVQRLDPELFKAWINLLCLGSSQKVRWTLPAIQDIAFALRISPADAEVLVERFISLRLIDGANGQLVVHDWRQWQRVSDDVTERVQKHRKTGNNVVTLHETPNRGSRTDTDTEQSRVTGHDVHLDVDFDAWWLTYPKKVGKGEALRIWKRLKPSDELVEKMISAVQVQSTSDQWRRNNGQFIPNPATWLNQGRWMDEGTTTPQVVCPPGQVPHAVYGHCVDEGKEKLAQ
jgi:hypothetical protein